MTVLIDLMRWKSCDLKPGSSTPYPPTGEETCQPGTGGGRGRGETQHWGGGRVETQH